MPRSAASAAFRCGAVLLPRSDVCHAPAATICITLTRYCTTAHNCKEELSDNKSFRQRSEKGKISVDDKGDVWYSNRTRERKALIFVFYFEKQYIYYIIRGGN